MGSVKRLSLGTKKPRKLQICGHWHSIHLLSLKGTGCGKLNGPHISQFDHLSYLYGLRMKTNGWTSTKEKWGKVITFVRQFFFTIHSKITHSLSFRPIHRGWGVSNLRNSHKLTQFPIFCYRPTYPRHKYAMFLQNKGPAVPVPSLSVLNRVYGAYCCRHNYTSSIIGKRFYPNYLENINAKHDDLWAKGKE